MYGDVLLKQPGKTILEFRYWRKNDPRNSMHQIALFWFDEPLIIDKQETQNRLKDLLIVDCNFNYVEPQPGISYLIYKLESNSTESKD